MTMSKSMLALGVVASLAAHAALVWGMPSRTKPSESDRATPIAIAMAEVPAVEAEPSPEPEPADDSALEPEPKPEPKPEPEAAPVLEPESSEPESSEPNTTEPNPSPEPVAPPAPPLPAPPAPPAPTPPTPAPPVPPVMAKSPEPLETPVAATADLPASGGSYLAHREGVAAPALRLEWGDEAEAISIVRRAALPVVLVGRDGIVREQLERRADGGWQRVPFKSGAGLSARVRVVDGTPAFRSATAMANPGERVAVMLTTSLEREIDQATRQAAARMSIPYESLVSISGRLSVRADRRVGFELISFERRS